MSSSDSSSGSDTGSDSPVEVKKKVVRRKKKTSDGPKRPTTSFMYFSKEMRSTIKEENPDASFGEIGKLVGAAWRELDEDEKEKYIKMNLKDKERYASEGGGPAKGGKKRKANAGPKRPLSAYVFFQRDRRSDFVAEHPDASFGEIGKILGAAWREMDADDRAEYVEMNKRDKVRYQKELDAAGGVSKTTKKKKAAPVSDSGSGSDSGSASDEE